MASSNLPDRRRAAGLGLILPAGLIALWWTASRLGWVNPHFIAPIGAVIAAPFDPIIGRLIAEGLAASLVRYAEGALIGATAGLAFGAWLGLSRGADRSVGPTFHAFRQIAMFAWVPLLTAWLGLGEATKITFIALAAFKPMVMGAHEGIRSIPKAYVEVGRAMAFSRWRMLSRIVLPAAAPSILTGLQMSFIYAWLATVGVETLIGGFGVGIGSVLTAGREHFQMDVVIFGIFLTGAIGFLVNLCLGWLSKGLFPTQTATA